MKTGIYYASTTGVTEDIAYKIADALGLQASDVHDAYSAAPATVQDYDLIILGASTHGAGDVQDGMEDFLAGVAPLDLKGKKIALFGCGDVNMTDTFCDGVGDMYERLQDTGATFVGAFPAGCYDFTSSRAIRGDKAVGLLLDEVNHANLTPERISQWCVLIQQ